MSTFEAVLLGVGDRGRLSLATINGREIGTSLADYFAGLKPERLAGAWVALVLDAVEENESLGALARALIVVATRLHGVTFAMPIEAPAPSPLRAQPMHRPGMTPAPSNPAPEPEDGVFYTPPPPPSSTSRVWKGACEKAGKTKINGWFLIDARTDGKKHNVTLLRKALSKAHPQIKWEAYLVASGQVCVVNKGPVL